MKYCARYRNRKNLKLNIHIETYNQMQLHYLPHYRHKMHLYLHQCSIRCPRKTHWQFPYEIVDLTRHLQLFMKYDGFGRLSTLASIATNFSVAKFCKDSYIALRSCALDQIEKLGYREYFSHCCLGTYYSLLR